MVNKNLQIDNERMESKIKERLESIKNEGEDTGDKPVSKAAGKPAAKTESKIGPWAISHRKKLIIGAIGLFLVFLFIQLKSMKN